MWAIAALSALFVADAWHYSIFVDPNLETITTTICVDRGKLPALETNDPFVERWLLNKPRAVSEKCARSRVALKKAAQTERDKSRVAAIGEDYLLSPDLFLLVPKDGFSKDVKITAKFQLPANIRVLTPWSQNSSGEFNVGRTSFDWRTMVVLGRFTPMKISAPGAELDVAILDAPMAATQPGVERWLSEAMRAVIQLYGEPPVSRAMIVVEPVPRGNDVQFGVVYRGGGPSALFLLGRNATDDVLPGEWTAVHELTHLAIPFVERSHAWLSEGFATYYQNILRARAGHLSAEEAWQQMHAGLERGRRDSGSGTLAEVAANMHKNHRYMRVYWSGTALALLADVELRASSNNTKSLDTTLRALRDCCAQDGRVWTLDELTAKLDQASSSKVFSTLFKKHVNSASFPDLEDSYRALGLKVESGQIRLTKDAPLVSVREAITAPRR